MRNGVFGRAMFASRSLFFAPKPHGNACYAGYWKANILEQFLEEPLGQVEDQEQHVK